MGGKRGGGNGSSYVHKCDLVRPVAYLHGSAEMEIVVGVFSRGENVVGVVSVRGYKWRGD